MRAAVVASLGSLESEATCDTEDGQPKRPRLGTFGSLAAATATSAAAGAAALAAAPFPLAPDPASGSGAPVACATAPVRQGDGDGRGWGSAAGSDEDDSGVPLWNPSPAARVAEEPNGAEGAKRRQRERGRGSKKRCLLASQISLVRNSALAAVRIVLKSTINGMTAPLSIDDAPSEDLMSLLLKNALEPHWEQFTLANTRTAKADGRRRSDQETWLSETRAEMHSHISKRADFEEQARRSRTLLFLLTVRSELGLAVAYEEECPGLARDLLGKDVLIMGAFSHSLDSVQHRRGSSKGNETRKAGGLSAELTRVARRKEGYVTKPGAEGAKDGLIKKLEKAGTLVVAIVRTGEGFKVSASGDFAPYSPTPSSGVHLDTCGFIQSAFRTRHEAFSALGSPDYSLTALAGVLSGKKTTGDLFIALGGCGGDCLRDITRDMRAQQGRNSPGYVCSAFEASCELLYELRLKRTSALQNRKKAQSTRTVRRESQEPRDRCDEGGDHESGAGGGFDASGSSSSSAALAADGYLNFERLALPRAIVCVRDEPLGSEGRSRIYAQPEYNDQGKPANSWVTITDTSFGVNGDGASDAKCRCLYSIQAHCLLPGTTGVPGCSGQLCFHQQLLVGPARGFLSAKPCISLQPFAHVTSSHHVLEPQGSSAHPSTSSFLHVVVNLQAGAAASERTAILTLTPGHISCPACYSGKKQEEGSARPPCPHAAYIREVIEAAEAGRLADLQVQSDAALFSSTLSTTDEDRGVVWFDTELGYWKTDSLSSKLEERNHKNLGEGARPVNVQISVGDISPVGCNAGGAADTAQDHSQPVFCIEAIPEFAPPLNGRTGCIYFSAGFPEGFWVEETDDNGKRHPGSKLHYLTHSRTARIHTRCCSMGHPECRVYYTGRADNVHRESYDSAFRHELPLLYWDSLSSGGTGAEQYVKLIQQIHRLGGGADAPGFLGRHFVGGETFRKCISGFLARQRRAFNRPCPSCPKEELDGQLVSACKDITVDAKRLRIPMRFLHAHGQSPDQTDESSPTVDVARASISERLMWPGGKTVSQARAECRGLTAAVLGTTLQKGEPGFPVGSSGSALLKATPPAFAPAVRLLVRFLADKEQGGSGGGSSGGGGGGSGPEEDESSDCRGSGGDSEDDGSAAQYHGDHSGLAGSKGGGLGSDSDSDVDGQGGERTQATREAPGVGRLPWICPAQVAGICTGDHVTHIDGAEVADLDALLAARPSQGSAVLELTVLRAGVQVRVRFRTGPGGQLFLGIHDAGHGKPAVVANFTTPPEGVMPMPPAPSPALAREIALQLHGINQKQCEATQWLIASDRVFLRRFLDSYVASGGFTHRNLHDLKISAARKSLARLIDAARYDGITGGLWMHPAAHSLLEAMVLRAEAVHAAAASRPGRGVPEISRPPYNPASGQAYHFTQKGERLYRWPKWKNLKSEAKSSCRKPDWMRISPNGMSEGVLTFMCLRSGVVIGTTFLTGHEGCKDAGSALYSYHPLRKLRSVVCDTPCMHATYMNTRCGRDFDGIKWTGDRFHIGAHKCFYTYDPSEYAWYNHLNTSMIEQWHATMRILAGSVRGSTLPRAMLLLQTLQDDHYMSRCSKMKYPEANWTW